MGENLRQVSSATINEWFFPQESLQQVNLQQTTSNENLQRVTIND